MQLSPDMAEAFGDWLERERIHRALLSARPELETVMVLEESRPMLRIPRALGGSVVVAKTFEGASTRWVVGAPGRPRPVIHEPRSDEEIVRLVLEELDRPGGRAVGVAVDGIHATDTGADPTCRTGAAHSRDG